MSTNAGEDQFAQEAAHLMMCPAQGRSLPQHWPHLTEAVPSLLVTIIVLTALTLIMGRGRAHGRRQLYR